MKEIPFISTTMWLTNSIRNNEAINYLAENFGIEQIYLLLQLFMEAI